MASEMFQSGLNASQNPITAGELTAQQGSTPETPNGPGAEDTRAAQGPRRVRRTVPHLQQQEEIRVNQRSRITGHTAPTTPAHAEAISQYPGNDMDEALRRVQGRPAPTSTPRTTAVAA